MTDGSPLYDQDTPPPAKRAAVKPAALVKVVVAILFFAAAVYGGYLYAKRNLQPVAVSVNGVVVTKVHTEIAARRVLDAIKESQSGAAFPAKTCKPLFKEAVDLTRIPSTDTGFDTDETAQAKLALLLHVTVIAYAVDNSGIPLVALPSHDLAQATLDALKKHYADMPPNDPIVSEPEFKEKVTIVPTRVPAALCRATPEDGVVVLTSGPPPVLYTVESGDTGFKIARKFKLNFAQFLLQNGGRDMNKLSVGDTINVSSTLPPLNVLVKKKSVTEEAIRKNASDDDAGRRRDIVIVTYLDGRQQGEAELLGVTTIHRATPERSVQ